MMSENLISQKWSFIIMSLLCLSSFISFLLDRNPLNKQFSLQKVPGFGRVFLRPVIISRLTRSNTRKYSFLRLSNFYLNDS